MKNNFKNYIELYLWSGWIRKHLFITKEKVRHPQHYIIDLDTNNIYEIEKYTNLDYSVETTCNLIHEKDRARVTRFLNYIDRKKLFKYDCQTFDYGLKLIVDKNGVRREVNLNPTSNTFKDLERIIK